VAEKKEGDDGSFEEGFSEDVFDGLESTNSE